jgi:hypothetical protein
MKNLIAAALIAASTTASGMGYYTGNDILRFMQGGEYAQGGALGYVAGVASAWDGEVFCVPPGVTVRQLNDIVQRFLLNRPSDRHEPAIVLVGAALVAAYPCKEQKNRREMY